MAGTYGQTGVTYGQAGGTYGDWGSSASIEAHTGGETTPARETDSSFARQYGFLRWRVHISGEGAVEHDSELLFVRVLQPVAATADLGLRLSYSCAASAEGCIGFTVERGDAQVTVFASRMFSTGLELRAISDPPALLHLLGLPAEVPVTI